jgi:hypothetical protein
VRRVRVSLLVSFMMVSLQMILRFVVNVHIPR